MTILTDEFLKNELDFDVNTSSSEKMYKDYYYTFCEEINKRNAFRPSISDLEEWIKQGYFDKAPYFKCQEKDAEQRAYLFKRAMGLQIIYDSSNGRNAMIKGTDGEYDIDRQSIRCLELLGLIQPVRW